MIKLVFCVRRRPELDFDEFRRYWLESHAPLVRRLRARIPQMKRYVQSHLIPGPASDGVRASRGAAEPYDGITEVWFDGLEALGGGSAASADAARQLLEDEGRFIDLARSSVFLTEEHEIF
jgi:uncharacterized protein (TIGR02118 family)